MDLEKLIKRLEERTSPADITLEKESEETDEVDVSEQLADLSALTVGIAKLIQDQQVEKEKTSPYPNPEKDKEDRDEDEDEEEDEKSMDDEKIMAVLESLKKETEGMRLAFTQLAKLFAERMEETEDAEKTEDTEQTKEETDEVEKGETDEVKKEETEEDDESLELTKSERDQMQSLLAQQPQEDVSVEDAQEVIKMMSDLPFSTINRLRLQSGD